MKLDFDLERLEKVDILFVHKELNNTLDCIKFLSYKDSNTMEVKQIKACITVDKSTNTVYFNGYIDDPKYSIRKKVDLDILLQAMFEGTETCTPLIMRPEIFHIISDIRDAVCQEYYLRTSKLILPTNASFYMTSGNGTVVNTDTGERFGIFPNMEITNYCSDSKLEIAAIIPKYYGEIFDRTSILEYSIPSCNVKFILSSINNMAGSYKHMVTKVQFRVSAIKAEIIDKSKPVIFPPVVTDQQFMALAAADIVKSRTTSQLKDSVDFLLLEEFLTEGIEHEPYRATTLLKRFIEVEMGRD